ncbi:MAG: MCE family protein [Streptosporangiales bacterium]|nr:MCE family protein [Streptosporangiales bacterium]
MPIRSSFVLRVGAVVVAAALVAGTVGVLLARNGTARLTAYFDRTVGLYEQSEVRVLGVKIGEVTKIMPQGSTVRVEMTYDAEQKVPADAKAVVLSPSVVSGRYVQLTPIYRGGPALQDGATIPVSRTAVPVEIDEIFASMNELSDALGPRGANRNGSLSRLLEVTADNMEGQGNNTRAAVENLSDAASTLSDSREDLFGTVRNLQQFTTALAQADNQVRAFNEDLADVSVQLDAERDELAAALKNLSIALAEVTKFVRDNRDELKANIEDLETVTKVLVNEQRNLAKVLDTAPLAVSNLANAYNPTGATLDTRANFNGQLQDPVMFLCSLVYSLGMPPSQCEPLLGPLNALAQKEDFPLGLDLSPLTSATSTDANIEPLPPDAYGNGGSGEAAVPGTAEPDPTLGGVLPGGGR